MDIEASRLMKLNDILTEAVDLRCPNCYDNLGKDVENPRRAYCGNCGTGDINNPRGYVRRDDGSYEPRERDRDGWIVPDRRRR